MTNDHHVLQLRSILGSRSNINVPERMAMDAPYDIHFPDKTSNTTLQGLCTIPLVNLHPDHRSDESAPAWQMGVFQSSSAGDIYFQSVESVSNDPHSKSNIDIQTEIPCGYTSRMETTNIMKHLPMSSYLFDKDVVSLKDFVKLKTCRHFKSHHAQQNPSSISPRSLEHNHSAIQQAIREELKTSGYSVAQVISQLREHRSIRISYPMCMQMLLESPSMVRDFSIRFVEPLAFTPNVRLGPPDLACLEEEKTKHKCDCAPLLITTTRTIQAIAEATACESPFCWIPHAVIISFNDPHAIVTTTTTMAASNGGHQTQRQKEFQALIQVLEQQYEVNNDEVMEQPSTQAWTQ